MALVIVLLMDAIRPSFSIEQYLNSLNIGCENKKEERKRVVSVIEMHFIVFQPNWIVKK